MAAMRLEPCCIYTLGSVGQEVFALYSGIKRQKIPFTPDRYSLLRGNHFLLHDLQFSEMFAQLQVAVKCPVERFTKEF